MSKNKLKNKGGWLFLLTLFLFGLPLVVAAKSDLAINEIFPNPKGSDKGEEFIELYNEDDESIDLDGWVLERTSKKGVVKEYKFEDEDKIEEGKYLKVQFDSLNNDGATIRLFDNEGEKVDEKEYGKSAEGRSYNRDEKKNKNDWYWAEPTGGDKNADNPANKKYPEIWLNEIFPNPRGDEKEGEFIELYNPNKEKVALREWRLRDGSKSGRYVFGKDDEIGAGKYFVVSRKEFKFALNNSGDEKVVLLDPNDDEKKGEYKDKIKYTGTIENQSYNRDEKKNENDWYWAEPTKGELNEENPINKKYADLLISEVLPNPRGEEKKEEFIELYNPNKKEVALEGWLLTDSSSKGQFVFEEGASIEAGEYLVVYRKDFVFALNNSGGEVVKLVAPNHKMKSEINYKSAKEGISYNFDLVKNNWRWSKFLTPGKMNKFNHLPTFKLRKPSKVYKDVQAEFEVDNLRDADGDKVKVSWDFGDGHKSYLQETTHKYKKTGKYKVQLIVKDGSEEVVKVFEIRVKKYPKYKLKIVGIMPNPNGRDKGKEIILIKNLEGEKVDLKNYKIGTGRSEDKISGHPFYEDFKIKAGDTKQLVNDDTCKFSLLNKGGVVQILYPNGKIADEVKYIKKKILPNEMYKLDEESGQWYWQGGVGVDSGKIGNVDVDVLGVKNTIGLDITLDDDLKICKTIKQIKRDNWTGKWVNKWLF